MRRHAREGRILALRFYSHIAHGMCGDEAEGAIKQGTDCVEARDGLLGAQRPVGKCHSGCFVTGRFYEGAVVAV